MFRGFEILNIYCSCTLASETVSSTDSDKLSKKVNMCLVYALSTNASGLQSLTWPQINIKLFLKNMHRHVSIHLLSISHLLGGNHKKSAVDKSCMGVLFAVYDLVI